MIEYVKTQHGCGHVSYRGSSFGYAEQEAEKIARESGYLREENSEDLCKECGGVGREV